MERFGAPFVVFDRSKIAQNGPKKKKMKIIYIFLQKYLDCN